MSIRQIGLIVASALVWYVFAGSAHKAAANDLVAFNGAVDRSYGHFRVAAAYLRTGNAALASLELEDAEAAWRVDVLPFADNVPPVFDGDPAFADDLSAIHSRLTEMLREANAGGTDSAYARSADVRAALSGLYRRNGFFRLSDCLWDLTQAMDDLWTYRHEPPDMNDRTAVIELSERIGAFDWIVNLCVALAPETTRGDDRFQRLTESLMGSIVAVRDAARDGDAARLISVLREQRSIERLLVMNFG